MAGYGYEPLPTTPTNPPRRSRTSSRFQSAATRLLIAATAFLLVLYAFLELRHRIALGAEIDLQLSSTQECTAVTETVFIPAPTQIVDPVTNPDRDSGSSASKIFKTSDYVQGPPTKSFKDNLRPDKQYLLGFLDAGWTNDVMTVANSIYLAMITSRIPILPPFPPHGDHMRWEDDHLLFSDVFDLPEFQKRTGIPMVEWKDLKSGVELETLGCWSPWMTAQEEHKPRGSILHDLLGLDVSFTATPSSTNLNPGSLHSSMWSLARLAYPEGRQHALQSGLDTRPGRTTGITLPPDEQVACYDYLYYVGVLDTQEWEKDYSPVWRFVGTHMRFNDNIIRLAHAFIRRALGVSEGEAIPPFISIHVRHGDFGNMCAGRPIEECYRPISAWAKDVDLVRQQLKETKGIEANAVIVTSDETNAEWWKEVEQQGWHFADHLAETDDIRYGPWLPIMIDACVQSLGAGFIGTLGSTMSLVSKRRVEEWNGGIGLLSRWGGWGMETDF